MADPFGISTPTTFNWCQKILILHSLLESDCKFTEKHSLIIYRLDTVRRDVKGLKYSKKRGGTSHQGDSAYQVKNLTSTNKSQTEM